MVICLSVNQFKTIYKIPEIYLSLSGLPWLFALSMG